ncbi:hypothetical protein BS78_08G163300 [Paspalum vaginatum]|nr:hypothetical protein BS78_08G163300 [Paspalum vaginatum]
MPSSPLKRPSAGGRLRRLLASLRPPARAGPLPVQTGFPTSLADLVVKNHARFHNPRRRHRAAAPPSPAPAEPVPQSRRELPVSQEDSAAPAPAAPPSPKAAAFSVRPELLAVGGAVALALLLIWSKLLVAAATLASVALLWIESAARSRASTRSPRRPHPETVQELGVRGHVSPIREAEESPRPPSCADSEPDRGSELGRDGASVTPEGKEKRRRSLRKLLAKKLQKPPMDKDSRHSEHPVASEVNAVPVGTTEPALAEGTTPSPLAAVSDDDERWNCRRVGALPLAAVAPVILVGLVAGKLPAVALTVLCAAVFSSSSISQESPRPSTTS